MFFGSSFSSVRICHFSLFRVIVNYYLWVLDCYTLEDAALGFWKTAAPFYHFLKFYSKQLIDYENTQRNTYTRNDVVVDKPI